MIASSRALMGASLALALAFHAVLGWALIARQEAQIEGSAGAQDTRLGDSFSDMAVGAMTPDVPDQVTPDASSDTPIVPDVPTAADPVPPVEAAAVPPPDLAQPSERPPVLTPAQTPTVPPDAPTPPLPAETAQPTPALAPDAVATLSSQPATEVEAQPDAPQTLTSPVTEEIVQADTEPSTAVTRSLRPVQRSAAFEKAHEKAHEKAAAPKPKKTVEKRVEQKKSSAGNAQQNATAGTSAGKQDTQATSSGTATGQSNAAGNAAASNYPGLVMQKISRVPRPSVGRRGTAVVAFSVSSSGGLAKISIARSSGLATLDRAALLVVRRAAPFPPPPQGAQRSFSISIKGR